MPYVINNSRGQIVAVIQDGTINTTSTTLSLVGKDVSPYGELEMTNTVHVLENFASSVPPTNPIAGQLWYDTGSNILYIWTINSAWKSVRSVTAAPTAPTTDPVIGDLWFDTSTRQLRVYDIIGAAAAWIPANKLTLSTSNPAAVIAGEMYYNTVSGQLFVYNGVSWVLIGPQAVSGFDTTAWQSVSLPDSASNAHAVIIGEVDGETIAILSSDAFTIDPTSAPAGFSNVAQGLTLAQGTRFSGLASQSEKLTPGANINGVLFDGSQNINIATVTSVGLTPGTGIAVSGGPVTSAGNITVTNTGVTAVLTGTGIGTDQSNGAVTVTNTGVTALASGTGIAVNQSNGAVTVTNTGVTALSSGTGISTSQANGAVSITNTGVTAFGAGAGLSTSSNTGSITVNNTGVLSLSTGSGLMVNQANGAVSITNLGVLDITAGNGLSTSSNTGSITLNNTGVTAITAGNGLSTSSNTGSITLNNTGVTRVVAGTNISVSPGDGLGNVTVSALGLSGGAVFVDSFGAIGDGTTDDSTAFQAAIDSLGSTGGRVLLSADKFYRIGSNITIKPSCHLQGQQNMIGSNGYNYYTDYDAIGSALWVDSSATIAMKSGSSISKMLIRQRGMTYTSPSSFAGTAVTILGTSPGAGNQGNTTVVGDDVTVYDCMFLGFNQAISAQYAQRLRVTQCNIDCVNGILVDAAFDVPYITRVHCWPFATIAAVAQGVAPNPNGEALTRTGAAFKFQNTVDWGKITDCFSYGYYRGYWINSCNSCELTGCGADNVPEAGTSGSGANGFLGFVIEGGSTDTILTNCQAASNEKGFYINTAADVPTQMINCVAWSNRNNGVLIEGGDVTLIGGIFRQSQTGITNTAASNRVIVQTARFSDISSRPIVSSSARTYIESCNFQNFTGSSPASVPTANITIPGTNSITVNNEGEFFVVSPGAGTGLGNVQWVWTGRRITIRFTGNVTVFNAGGSPAAGDMYLAGGANFSATANDTVSLISDGTYWYEIGRSI